MALRLKRNMVKQSIDNLPTGICFFDENGILILCNRIMYRLFYEITGHDLQSLSEFRKMTARLERDNMITLSDCSVWSIEESELADNSGNKYIQFTASNVTELYSAVTRLEERKANMSELASHLEKLNKNIIAIMREEEILSMKMRVHNEMGSTLLKIDRYFEKGLDDEGKDTLVQNLRSTTALLLGGVDKDDGEDSFNELLEIARGMGVEIVLDGNVPEDSAKRNLILSAVRECLTNAIKYAGAGRLFVAITGNGVQITNDGTPPKEEIVEGGGLTSLRKKANRSGCSIEIESHPRFIMKLFFGEQL